MLRSLHWLDWGVLIKAAMCCVALPYYLSLLISSPLSCLCLPSLYSYGLPISRAYARYFGGDLRLVYYLYRYLVYNDYQL